MNRPSSQKPHSRIFRPVTNSVIVPGSTYWNFGVGLNPGDVEKDVEATENMHDLGETIAWLLKSLCKG